MDTKQAVRVLVVAFGCFLAVIVIYAGFGAMRLRTLCTDEAFMVVNFNESPGSGYVKSGYSLIPPGFYCELDGTRVVQFFPHGPSDEELAEVGFPRIVSP